jgi:hypothetical protein
MHKVYGSKKVPIKIRRLDTKIPSESLGIRAVYITEWLLGRLRGERPGMGALAALQAG